MKNYTPSNSTDGMEFMARFCEKCYKEEQCTILTSALMGNVVKQWVYNFHDKPVCTSFKSERPKRKAKQLGGGLFHS